MASAASGEPAPAKEGASPADTEDSTLTPSEVEEGVEESKAESEEEDTWIEESIKDVKVATIGNVDSGKSTLVGVLTKGLLDDGRGLARSRVFNFTHEAQNGRTSSVAQEIMGFNEQGELVNADRPGAVTAASRNASWQHVMSQSQRLITFIDLCGHEKYLKTTIFGLIGLCPDYAMIIVNANAGFQRMSREHLGIALALRIPFLFIVTKIDIAPANVFEENMRMLHNIVKSKAVRRQPMLLSGETDLAAATEGLVADRVCPILQISSLTGEGLPLLRAFLQRLPSRLRDSGLFRPPSAPAEFHIDSIFNVNGVGLVVAGLVKAGRIHQNQQLLLGPDKTGQFKPVLVKTIHYKRVLCEAVESGQHSAIALRSLVKRDTLKKTSFRKGMVLVDAAAQPQATKEFKAEVVILHHATTIRTNYQAVIHCGIIRQCAAVKHMSADLLQNGDKATVTFRFMYHGEFLRLGMPLLFREGRTKGLGRIVEVIDESACAG